MVISKLTSAGAVGPAKTDGRAGHHPLNTHPPGRGQRRRARSRRSTAHAGPELKTTRPGLAPQGDALYAMELALSLEKLNFTKLRELHDVAEAEGDAQMCDFVEGDLLDDQVRRLLFTNKCKAPCNYLGGAHLASTGVKGRAAQGGGPSGRARALGPRSRVVAGRQRRPRASAPLGDGAPSGQSISVRRPDPNTPRPPPRPPTACRSSR